MPIEPALCLLCGRWLCASQNRCCYDANTHIGAVSGKTLVSAACIVFDAS
jgi:hypothetical protein